MRLPRQLINALGALLVVVVLGAGVALGALPMYLDSLSISSQAMRVAQDNTIYQTQVAALRSSDERISDVEDSLEDLREGIPRDPLLDSVFELVAESAVLTTAAVESITREDPQPWVPRTGPEAQEDAVAEPADESAPAGEDADAAGAAAAATAADSGSASGPEQEIAVTIVVLVPDSVHAAAFLDALRRGPRLLGIEHAQLSEEEGALRLTVNALAFVRTDAS